MTFFKWSRTAASNGTADSTCPFPEGMAASALNDGSRGMMAAAAKYRDDVAGAIVTGGTSTAYTVSSYQAFASLATLNGQVISFSPHANSGAPVTLNVDGLGAKPLRSAPGVELTAGALVLGAPYTALYNNADGAFYLKGAFGSLGNTTITGTLGVSGAVAFSSTLGVAGDFAVNTNKFTVAAASGNTAVAGTFDATGAGTFASTLSAVGDFAINTNKFNVNAATGNTAIGGTLAVTGASAFTGAVSAASSVLSSSPSAGIGYKTGAGNSTVQPTSKNTTVTLNAICGQITTANSSLSGSFTTTSFTFNNSAIGATDTVLVTLAGGSGQPSAYIITAVGVAAGSCKIAITNGAGSALAEALVINFVVIKAVTS